MAAIGEVATDEFVHVMIANPLSPMRVIEALNDLVPASGFLGATHRSPSRRVPPPGAR